MRDLGCVPVPQIQQKGCGVWSPSEHPAVGIARFTSRSGGHPAGTGFWRGLEGGRIWGPRQLAGVNSLEEEVPKIQ